MSEFGLIERYFSQLDQAEDVSVGVGDDGAVLDCAGQRLVVVTDTMVEGVHFPESTAPADIAWKAVAVNLSDLAAMGATPRWISLALTLPSEDESWLSEFSRGLHEICQRYSVALVGGDTTRGALTITVTAHGLLDSNPLLRSSAQVGDDIYVTGTLGDAGLGLACVFEQIKLDSVAAKQMKSRLDRPTPRCELGVALKSLANACIDVSDGLLADLGHILEASKCGADLNSATIPLSEVVKAQNEGLKYALTSGDDYELCFTASQIKRTDIEALSKALNTSIVRIGKITEALGMTLDGDKISAKGYQHF